MVNGVKILMNRVIKEVYEKLNNIPLSFLKKPIIIGGVAMGYYGMRMAGADVDLIISDEDYHVLSEKYPDNKKDLYLMKEYYYEHYRNKSYLQEWNLK